MHPAIPSVRTCRLAILTVTLLLAAGCRQSAPDLASKSVSAGDKHFANAKYEDAAIEYRKALQQDKNFAKAHYGLARVELTARKRGLEAFQHIRLAAELMPENEEIAELFTSVGITAYLNDPRRSPTTFETLVKTADQILAKNPNSVAGLRLKAGVGLLEGKSAVAIEYYRKALVLKPKDRDSVIGLVQALFRNGQNAVAEKTALDFIGQDKSFNPLYDLLLKRFEESVRVTDIENLLKLQIENQPAQSAPVLALARHYHRFKQQSKINETLQRLLKNTQDYPQGPLAVGDFYLETGNPTEAIQLFQEGIKSASKYRPLYQKRLATLLVAQGKQQEAMEIIESLLKDDPKNNEARIARATLAIEGRDPAKLQAGIAELQTLVKELPDNADVHHRLGQALYRNQDLSGAAAELRLAINFAPKQIQPLILLGQIELTQRNPEAALRYADAVLAVNPEMVTAKYIRVASLIAQDKIDEARPELARLEKAFPDSPEIKLQRGLFLLRLKNYPAAEAIFRSVQQKPGVKDIRPAIGLVEAVAGQNQLDRVIQILTAEVAGNPDSLILRSLLAEMATRAGILNLALEQHKAILAKSPNSPDLLIRLGDFYTSQGDIQNARTTLERAKQLAPKSPAPWLSMALTYEKAGQLTEAQSQYRKALELDPENSAVLNNLAFLLADSGGNLDEAMRLVSLGLKKQPKAPWLLDTQAWIHLKRNSPDSAIQILNVLVRSNPEISTLHYHLGAALVAKGNKALARAALQQALTLKPPAGEDRKIKQLLETLGT